MCVCDTRLTKNKAFEKHNAHSGIQPPPPPKQTERLILHHFFLFLYNPVVIFMSGSSVLVVGGILSDLAWHIGHRMCIAVKCQESIIIPSCLNF